jgi:hypothetical protein
MLLAFDLRSKIDFANIIGMLRKFELLSLHGLVARLAFDFHARAIVHQMLFEVLLGKFGVIRAL